MLSNYFSLDAKSISRLSSRGLSIDALKAQLEEDLELSLEIWRSQGLNIVKKIGLIIYYIIIFWYQIVITQIYHI